MSQPQSQTLIDLSNQLAGAVERGAESIVAVHARPQLASTGVHWRDGLVVTTNGTVRSDVQLGETPDYDDAVFTATARSEGGRHCWLRLDPGLLTGASRGDRLPAPDLLRRLAEPN